jgi:hypothetical protein
MPPVSDKIRAKTTEMAEMEASTHVFGSFNARKAERLIAPQQDVQATHSSSPSV